jgi:hypothetical protein
MSVKQSKVEVSKLFFNNWTETKIHWYGLEFDITGLDEWIRVSYQPTSQKATCIDGEMNNNTGVIDVDIFARKELRTFEIYDMISSIVSNNDIPNIIIRSIDIENKTLVSTDNGDYMELKISIYLKTI